MSIKINPLSNNKIQKDLDMFKKIYDQVDQTRNRLNKSTEEMIKRNKINFNELLSEGLEKEIQKENKKKITKTFYLKFSPQQVEKTKLSSYQQFLQSQYEKNSSIFLKNSIFTKPTINLQRFNNLGKNKNINNKTFYKLKPKTKQNNLSKSERKNEYNQHISQFIVLQNQQSQLKSYFKPKGKLFQQYQHQSKQLSFKNNIKSQQYVKGHFSDKNKIKQSFQSFSSSSIKQKLYNKSPYIRKAIKDRSSTSLSGTQVKQQKQCSFWSLIQKNNLLKHQQSLQKKIPSPYQHKLFPKSARNINQQQLNFIRSSSQFTTKTKQLSQRMRDTFMKRREIQKIKQQKKNIHQNYGDNRNGVTPWDQNVEKDGLFHQEHK